MPCLPFFVPPKPRSLALLALTLLLWAPATASAQADDELSPDYRPRPKFWEWLIDPDQVAYEEAIAEGQRAQNAGYHSAALLAFESAIALKPDAIEALLHAASAAQEAKAYASAIDYYLRARALDEEADSRWGVCFNAAIVYAKLSRWEETIAEYERCLVAQPRLSAVIYNNAAEIHMAKGDLATAIDFYRLAISDDTNLVHGNFGLGVALERAGDRLASRHHLLQGLLLDPNIRFMFDAGTFFVPEGEFAYQLAVLYRELGRHREAAHQLQRYLKSEQPPAYLAQAQRLLTELQENPAPLIDSYPLPSRLVSAVAVDSQLRWLVLGTSDGRISMIDRATNGTHDYRTTGNAVVDIAFTARDKEVRVLQADGAVLRLDPQRKLRRLGEIAGSDQRIGLDLSADGAHMLALTPRGIESLPLPSLKSPTLLLDLDISEAITCATSADRSILALFAERGFILSVDDQRVMGTFRHSGPAFRIEGIPGQRAFAVAGATGLSLVNSDGSLAKVILPPEKSMATAVSLDPTGRYAVVAYESLAEIWDLHRLEPRWTPDVDPNPNSSE